VIFRGFCIQMNWKLSGWQDSNLRPPAPKAGAIPGYATSRTWYQLLDPFVKVESNFLSGWQDSNLRPPAPKAGAIPGYATSRTWYHLLDPFAKGLLQRSAPWPHKETIFNLQKPLI
jgi:hypothetical protein